MATEKKNYTATAKAALLNISNAEKALNELAASAVKFAILDQSGEEGNVLLHLVSKWREADAALLRQYFIEQGPFESVSNRKVSIDGMEVTVDKAVKYSAKALEKNIGSRNAEVVYDFLCLYGYREWAEKARAERKAASKAANAEKTEQEKKEEIQEKMRKLIASAKKAGLSFTEILPESARQEVTPPRMVASVTTITNLIQEALTKGSGLLTERERAALELAMANLDAVSTKLAA